MSFIGNAIGSVLGGVTGAKQSAKGAQQAAQTQANAADRAIAEQRDARLTAQQLQSPFVQAGQSSLAAQMNLLGLNGSTAQQTAMNSLLTSPEYTTSVRQGEEAILQNAAATGGLRGGNTQNSLANFRSDLLQNLYSQQYARLGGITSLGQNAAAGVGNAGLQVASNIGDLLSQQGAVLAGGQIAKGNVTASTINQVAQIAGTVLGASGGGRRAAASPQPVGF